MEALAYLGVFCLVAYTVYVLYLLRGATEYTGQQRVFQAAIVVLLPLFGAIICHVVLRAQRRNSPQADAKFVRQEPNDWGL
jgi:hypothetical protein